MTKRLSQMRLISVKGRMSTNELKNYISERHYLKSTPPEGIVKLWVILDNVKIGALMFGRPTNRNWAELPILENTRCVFEDDTPPMVESRALSLARKYIRTYLPNIRLVLAYASSGQGHEGKIYEADGWSPLGRTKGREWGNFKRPRITRDASDKNRWVRTP